MVWTCQESLWLLTGDSRSFAREKSPIKIPEMALLWKQDCGFCDCSLNGDLFAALIDLGAVMFTNGKGAAVNVVELGLHKDHNKYYILTQ